MQPRRSRRTLPALLCAACAAAPAAAALTARASISEMHISVVDLTPEDGAPAGFSVAGYRGNLFARLETDTVSDADSDDPALGMPGRAAVSAPGMDAAIYTSGTIGEAVAEMHVAANAVSVSAEGDQYWQLSLLPHSRLVIQGRTVVEALWTRQPYAWDYFAEASTYMNITAEDGAPFEVGHWLRFSGDYLPQELREAEDYTYIYENVSDSAMHVNFSARLWAGGHAGVSAVPEPDVFSMLFGGIATLVAWQCRPRAASRSCREAA